MNATVRRRLATSSVLASLLLAASSSASADDVLEGKWAVRWDGTPAGECSSTTAYIASLNVCEGMLILADGHGTLRQSGTGFQRRNNSCIGIAYPVTVLDRGPTSARLDVKGSAVVRGCPDLVIAVRIDGTTLTGALEDGGTVRLSRQ